MGRAHYRQGVVASQRYGQPAADRSLHVVWGSVWGKVAWCTGERIVHQTGGWFDPEAPDACPDCRLIVATREAYAG